MPLAIRNEGCWLSVGNLDVIHLKLGYQTKQNAKDYHISKGKISNPWIINRKNIFER